MKRGLNKGLGKGLDALLAVNNTDDVNAGVVELKINNIEPNIGQPRKHFDADKLQALADSIREHGVVQPILVKKDGERYLIVAGERRWRASKLAGLKTIPVIIREFTSREIMEIALIENLQREDLNPIEEAEAYQRLMDEYELTQEDVAKIVGKSRSAVANAVRLLSLSGSVRDMVTNGSLSSGHARTLVSISSLEKQDELATKMVDRGITVRQAEQWVQQLNTIKETPVKKIETPEWEDLIDKMRSALGTKVEMSGDLSRGKITLSYFSKEELDRLFEHLTR